MDQRQTTAMQRALVCEAIGKLRAAEQLFGTYPGYAYGPVDDIGYDAFKAKVDEFEEWVFDESGIA